MYTYFRRIRNIGRYRAWHAANTDWRAWDEGKYPPPPRMRDPGIVIKLGSWADIAPSSIKVNRFSHTRKRILESQQKLRRLHKRRKARQYRDASEGWDGSQSI